MTPLEHEAQKLAAFLEQAAALHRVPQHHPRGPGQMAGFGEPGTTGSFAWCDLRSADPDAAKSFYGKVFGFTYTAL